MHSIIFTEFSKNFKNFISDYKQKKICVLADSNTKRYCLDVLIKLFKNGQDYHIIEIKPGEKSKNINTCLKIWKQMNAVNADRGTLLINLGGGVLCDIGGFASSTYKRGIDYINIPTTLMAMVDAAVGGKTAINIGQLKNNIGLFAQPLAVFINTSFLQTLPKREITNAYAEIIKYALIKSPIIFKELINNGIDNSISIIKYSVDIKTEIVTSDEKEDGIRKILNFGHTVGHALEMLSKEICGKTLRHGEAVAAGIICEAYMSSVYYKTQLPTDEINALILKYFPPIKIDKKYYDALYQLMTADKKNKNGEIRMVLLKKIGEAVYDIGVKKSLIFSSFNYYNALRK